MSNYTFDVLAEQTATCEFVGIEQSPCMFRTALCPDRCGHATEIGIFTVTKTNTYVKEGKYGDKEVEVGGKMRVQISGEVLEQPASIAEQVRALAPGSKCEVAWKHIYVSREGAQFPARPCTSIQAI